MIKLSRPQCPNQEVLRTNYKHTDNKTALILASHDKCMYCESKVSHAYYGDIEHIKPKSKFPDLKFDWGNLGYVCARCNGYKSDKYDEANPILNPYDEDPETHLVVLGAVFAHKDNSERGKMTIEEQGGVHLNRPALIERRQDRINLIKKVIDACAKLEDSAKEVVLESIKPEAEADKEYSLCIKALLKTEGID